jgi:hypothetical protein
MCFLVRRRENTDASSSKNRRWKLTLASGARRLGRPSHDNRAGNAFPRRLTPLEFRFVLFQKRTKMRCENTEKFGSTAFPVILLFILLDDP